MKAAALLGSMLASCMALLPTPKQFRLAVHRHSQPPTDVKDQILRPSAEFLPETDDGFPDELTEKQKEVARLRAAEKFIKEETGIYICNVCSYKYDPEPGTAFGDLPASWRCPTCRAAKDAFTPVTLEIAGFAENQSYGLGGNSMTSDSKNALIFGSLFAFFALFMAGYLLN